MSSCFGQWEPCRKSERGKRNEDGRYVSLGTSSEDRSWQGVLQLQLRSLIVILPDALLAFLGDSSLPYSIQASGINTRALHYALVALKTLTISFN